MIVGRGQGAGRSQRPRKETARLRRATRFQAREEASPAGERPVKASRRGPLIPEPRLEGQLTARPFALLITLQDVQGAVQANDVLRDSMFAGK